MPKTIEERVTDLEKFYEDIPRLVNIRVNRVDRDLAALNQRVSGLDQRVSGLDQRVSGLDQRISQLEDKVDALPRVLAEMLKDKFHTDDDGQ